MMLAWGMEVVGGVVVVTTTTLLTNDTGTRAVCSTTGFANGSLGKATHFINVNNTVDTLKKSVSAVKAGPTNVKVCHDGSIVAAFDFSTCKVRDACGKLSGICGSG